jgi:N-acetylglucosaminyl-diphospho-decaprenol L-rhamnosyltransferase
VIVVTYNGADRVALLLESLRRQSLEHRLLVVDNGSTDGTRELLESRFSEAEILALPENLGFGRAVNRGVAACSTPNVVLLNNDVICEPPFLESLVASLAPDADIVMAAGVLLDAADPARIDSAGVIFDRSLLAVDHLHGEPVSMLANATDPLGPTGGAAAFDRAAFESVGGFDEQFFAYLEDVDLVARLLRRGARCRLARDARAVHRHSATLGSGSALKNELMGWSRGYTIGKYRLHQRPLLLVRAAAAELAITCGQAAIDRTLSGGGARLRGFRAGLAVPAEALPVLPSEPPLGSILRRRLSRRRAL